MTTKRNVRYSPLSVDDDDDYNNRGKNPRYNYTPKSLDKIPWKSIALSLFLLVLGRTLLCFSYFIVTGHMGGENSQAYGLLGLGLLTFSQGFMKHDLHIIHGETQMDTGLLQYVLIEERFSERVNVFCNN